jgi:hypothetical protein
MGAAKELASHFHAMSDDRAVTVFAAGRHRLNGTLEAVEGMPMTGSDEIEALIVFVAANLALSHNALPLRWMRLLSRYFGGCGCALRSCPATLAAQAQYMAAGQGTTTPEPCAS